MFLELVLCGNDFGYVCILQLDYFWKETFTHDELFLETNKK